MRSHLLATLVPSMLLAACNNAGNDYATNPPEPAAGTDSMSESPAVMSESESHAAQAVLTPTEGNSVGGTLRLESMPAGVRVVGEVTGLEAGSTHGFHVHETGDCSAPDASSAGGHFNPDGVKHGGPMADAAHVGDMANIEANDEGTVMVDATIDDATLGNGAAHDVMGKAIIVHAMPDDYETQPSGDAGARVACGVIG